MSERIGLGGDLKNLGKHNVCPSSRKWDRQGTNYISIAQRPHILGVCPISLTQTVCPIPLGFNSSFYAVLFIDGLTQYMYLCWRIVFCMIYGNYCSELLQ